MAIHLLRRVRRVDDESGLTAARLSALSVLVFGGGTTLGHLARAEQVSAPTMSRLVGALEREGLATREPHTEDGRAVIVRATEEGRARLLRGRERRVAELVELLDGASPESSSCSMPPQVWWSRFRPDLHPLTARMLALPRKGGGPT